MRRRRPRGSRRRQCSHQGHRDRDTEMSRQDDLAAIDAAILAAQLAANQQAQGQGQGQGQGIDPYLALATPELSEGQARYLEEQRKRRREAEAERARLSKEQEAILKAQEDLLGEEEAERLRAEQEEDARKSAIVKGTQSAIQKARQVARKADLSLGAIPTPGSIALPLILLIFLGFVLLQYNGNSKLIWLWLVLTNNAYVGGGGTAPMTDTPPATNTPQQGPLTGLAIVGAYVPRSGAGIQEAYY